jgi:alanine dehydrogenase
VRSDRALAHGVNVYAGQVTNQGVAEAHDLAFVPLGSLVDGLS